MSYGTSSGVAALVPRYVNGAGAFDASTRPTLNQVNEWLEQVSAVLDAAMTAEHMTTPVTGDLSTALEFFVNQEVAAIAEGVNGSGRFGPSQSEPGATRFQLILTDVRQFVSTYAKGVNLSRRPERVYIELL